MWAKIPAWYLHWSFTFSCRICCLGTQSTDRSCLATISCGLWWPFHYCSIYGAKWSTTPNWADLVERSWEQVTDEHYELTKMWLLPTPEPGDISMPDCTNNDPNLGKSSQTNPSISTVSTRIEPSLSNLGLSSLLNASRLSNNYVSCLFLHPASSFLLRQKLQRQ